MKFKRSQSNSGVALIIVMLSLVGLSILAGIFAFRMKVEARLALNSNNDTTMDWMARSGAERAKWLLGQEMQAGCPDSSSSVWSGGSGAACQALSNSPIVGITLPWTFDLGDGQVTVHKMIDLERKANINNANEQVLEPMLEKALLLMGVDPGDHQVVINSILDWTDTDKAERPQGAESDYYQAEEPPYSAKDAPIDDMSELIQIRGARDLYTAADVAYHTASPDGRRSNQRLGFNADVPIYQVGLVDLFTPLSSGRININTAGEAVLQLLPDVDEYTAKEIIRVRAGFDEIDGTEDDVPYRNPGEIINAIPNRATVERILPLIDVRSRTFEVTITAAFGNYSRDFRAILVRNNPNDVQLISFHAVEKYSSAVE